MKRLFQRIMLASFGFAILGLLPLQALAQASANTSSDPCPRPAAGSVVQPPPDLFSENGVLNVSFNYYTTVDFAGRTLFCFVTADGYGLEGPTLHVHPGDTINMAVTNQVPAAPPGSPTEVLNSVPPYSPLCPGSASTVTITSVNVHSHGLNTSPACGGDQVIKTVINSGATFNYSFVIPQYEPPGLYWYHPHIHGLAEAAVQGGGTGVIIVEGIGAFEPSVVGLPERVLIVRDQPTIGFLTESAPGGAIPGWDVSLNYVPIPYSQTPPTYTPAIIQMAPGQKELWRVANSAADTILDIQLQYDGVPQTLWVVALDGVPTNSQDTASRGTPIPMTDILLAPAGRAEFIVTGPTSRVQNATFMTLNVNTGPDGDNDPTRPLATIQQVQTEPPLPTIPPEELPTNRLFAGLTSAPITATRQLYFSEVLSNPSNPASPTNFFITVEGATPTLFDANNPPSIITTQGAVEQWTVQNQAQENHEFHIHQQHFMLQAINGTPVPPAQQQFYDTINIPYWDGATDANGNPIYPSVTLLMDFRGAETGGDFVYHCHILAHEDGGMMAIIRVLPPSY